MKMSDFVSSHIGKSYDLDGVKKKGYVWVNVGGNKKKALAIWVNVNGTAKKAV